MATFENPVEFESKVDIELQELIEHAALFEILCAKLLIELGRPLKTSIKDLDVVRDDLLDKSIQLTMLCDGDKRVFSVEATKDKLN